MNAADLYATTTTAPLTLEAIVDTLAKVKHRRVFRSQFVPGSTAYVMDDPDHPGSKVAAVSPEVYERLRADGWLTDDGFLRDHPTRRWHPPMIAEAH